VKRLAIILAVWSLQEKAKNPTEDIQLNNEEGESIEINPHPVQVAALLLLTRNPDELKSQLAQILTGEGKSIVLAYTSPLWVVPAAWFFLREPLTVRRLLGLLIGLSGVVLIMQPGQMDWSDSNIVIGHVLMLTGALCWAISIVYGRVHKWVTPPFSLLPWQMLVGGVVQLVLALVLEGIPQINWTLELWLLIGFNCLIGNGVAYWLMNLVSRDLPAGMVSMGLLGVPVIGLVCASVFLGETLGLPLVLAAGLIIVGIVLGTMSGRKKNIEL
jgi:drug/metabolite transporter (DMT)-like permease